MKRTSSTATSSQVGSARPLPPLIVPENILLAKRDDLSSIKIADFGLSDKYRTLGLWRLDKHCGTKLFMAPEIIFQADYSKSVDIWASGVIMFMLLTGGRHPLYVKGDTNSVY